MAFYVAVESFRDADGDMIVAGVTHVLDEADVFKKHPARFKRTKYMLRHSLNNGGAVERIGGKSEISRAKTKQRTPRKPSGNSAPTLAATGRSSCSSGSSTTR